MLADTHVVPAGRRQLPHPVYDLLDEADLVLHAGDLTSPDVLHELRAFAPVEAVLGNNDHELLGILPETTTVVVDGYRIGMVHDSGLDPGRAHRMRRRFPDASMVVFGLSSAFLGFAAHQGFIQYWHIIAAALVKLVLRP